MDPNEQPKLRHKSKECTGTVTLGPHPVEPEPAQAYKCESCGRFLDANEIEAVPAESASSTGGTQ